MNELLLALKILDGITAVTKGMSDYLEAMRPIKEQIERARDENRSLSPDELQALRFRSDQADARLREFLAENE